MRAFWLILVGGLAAGAFLLGARGGREAAPAPGPRPPTRPAASLQEPMGPPPREPVRTPEGIREPARRLPPFDVRARLQKFAGDEIARMEEEFEARVAEDPAFAERLFEAFLAESDPVKLSFLQNVIASDPRLRNSPEWQRRFMKVAEGGDRIERRAPALLFLQQAETIRAVHDRMLGLAENDRELCPHALAALKGLPDRRMEDPRLAEVARRIADREIDPDLRGLAIRLANDPARADRALADPDRILRMHAAHAASREALEAALKGESDPEVRQLIEARLATLK